MPTVSVIIPTYKHRDFVMATLDSVFAQTFTDYEVIVVNDGSPDDTAEVLRPLIEAGRIRYIEQANAGQAAARNRGIAEAKSDLIALLDDDDLWPPDKLEWQQAALAGQPEAGMVAGSLVLVDADANPVETPPQILDVTYETLFRQNPFISPGQTLIRASVLKRIQGLNVEIRGADDWDLWFRIARTSTILVKDRLALLYRVHAGNASRQGDVMLHNCCRVVEMHLENVAPEKRKALRATAYQTLYGYFGMKLLGQTKEAIRAGQWRRLPPYGAALLRLFITVIAIHPKYAYRIFRDLLPSLVRGQFAAIKIGIRKRLDGAARSKAART